MCIDAGADLKERAAMNNISAESFVHRLRTLMSDIGEGIIGFTCYCSHGLSITECSTVTLIHPPRYFVYLLEWCSIDKTNIF